MEAFRGRSRGRSNNLVSLLSQRSQGTRTLRSLEQLPVAFLAKLNRENEKIPDLAMALGRNHVEGDLSGLRGALEAADKHLSDRSLRWVHGEETQNTQAEREAFVVFGGARWLVMSLLVPINEAEARAAGWRGPIPSERAAWEMRKTALQLLRDLCYSMAPLTEELCGQEGFVVFLFSLMWSGPAAPLLFA